jgi:hypothetical protein
LLLLLLLITLTAEQLHKLHIDSCLQRNSRQRAVPAMQMCQNIPPREAIVAHSKDAPTSKRAIDA